MSGARPVRDAEVVDALSLASVGDLDAVGGGLHLFDLRPGHELDVLLAKLTRDDLRDLGILARQHLVQHLEQ